MAASTASTAHRPRLRVWSVPISARANAVTRLPAHNQICGPTWTTAAPQAVSGRKKRPSRSRPMAACSSRVSPGAPTPPSGCLPSVSSRGAFTWSCRAVRVALSSARASTSTTASASWKRIGTAASANTVSPPTTKFDSGAPSWRTRRTIVRQRQPVQALARG